MSHNNIYDDLAPVLGLPEGDQRIRLFLHLVINPEIRDRDRLLLHGVDIWEKKDGVAEDEVDPEWAVFGVELHNALEKMRTTTVNDSDNVERLNRHKEHKDLITFIDAIHPRYIFNPDKKSFETKKKDESEKDRRGFLLARKLLKYPDYETMNAIGSADENKKYVGRKLFTYKLSKAVAHSILESAKNAPTLIGGPSKFLASLDSVTDAKQYFRVDKEPTKLFTKNDKGDLVEVQRGSNKFWEESSKNCGGLYVKENGEHKCADYLIDCIAGSDPKKCRDYMSDVKFWGDDKDSVKAEVKSMLPALALTTLEKFGFKQISSFDSVAKRNINQMETVDSWLERLGNEMGVDNEEFKKIQGNTSLVLYLGLLVEKFKTNPAILNENINESEGTLQYNPAKFNGQLLASYGLRPKVPVSHPVISSTNRLSILAKTALNVPSNRVVLTVGTGLPIMMRGGAVVNEEYKLTSVELENQYNLLKNMLKANGKDIDSSNDLEIKALISSFKNTENKLVQTMKIMDKYVELMNAFEYNDQHKVLNLETLDAIVKAHDHQLNKSTKKQEGLIQAIQTLADVVQEAVNKVGSKATTTTPSSVAYTGSAFTHNN